MSNKSSITVNQEGVKSFAAALWNPQQYEIFVDDQKVGVLDGYTNHKTCAISPGRHSVYVRLTLATACRSLVSTDIVRTGGAGY
jgi:hypothetical protein